MIIQITAPHFCAGMDTETGQIAPIIRYMEDWSFNRIVRYCHARRWTIHLLFVDLLRSPNG